jgi:NADH dehydrogenase [ubiquinone] 1 alpha subcomplex assembly factor 7
MAREAREVAARGEAFAARLIARIRENGPISIAAYMRECNAHYYATRDPFGAAGDFTTAPEISQVFGELIGVWCADYWQRMGAPDPVLLVELGPGRGTLMADALRATRHVPGFHAAIRLHLVEFSPRLRALQGEKLGVYKPQFHGAITSLPPGPMLLIANEFLDALPIMQFECQAGALHERKIGCDGAALMFTRAPQPAGEAALPGANDGAIKEVNPTAYALMRWIARRIAPAGGAALVIDYGYDPSGYGDTLQAVRGHRYHSILESPGRADITAHVDFRAVAESAARGGAKVYGPVPQADFLAHLGIEARAAALLNAASPTQQEAIRSGVRRLIAPEEMGRLFKVLALTQEGGPVPAGFGTAA